MEGIFPAPNAAALPGSKMKAMQNTRSHEPAGALNDDLRHMKVSVPDSIVMQRRHQVKVARGAERQDDLSNMTL